MRERYFLIAAMAALLGVLPLATHTAHGQEKPQSNPAPVITVKAKITKVFEHTGKKGWQGAHFLLKTKEGILDVHTGPTDYVKEQGFEFKVGEMVEVTGAKIKYEGTDALIARVVKAGNKVLNLRDDQGVPVWPRDRWG
jgi:hypothetical protein